MGLRSDTTCGPTWTDVDTFVCPTWPRSQVVALVAPMEMVMKVAAQAAAARAEVEEAKTVVVVAAVTAEAVISRSSTLNIRYRCHRICDLEDRLSYNQQRTPSICCSNHRPNSMYSHCRDSSCIDFHHARYRRRRR